MGTRHRLVILAVLLIAVGAFGAAARAEIVQSGDVRVKFDASLSPKALPRKDPAPIAVEVGGEISTTDDTTPPPLQRLQIELNKAGEVDTRGLASCPSAQLQSTSSDAALARCRSSLVGRGTFGAELPIAGRPRVSGRALVFNGEVGGHPGMLIHVYISAPVRLTLVIPIGITHNESTFGTVLTATVPKLAGGAGAITELRLRIGRRFHAGGESRSYLNAACAAPAGFPGAIFPFARIRFAFADGRSMHDTLNRDCKVQPTRGSG